MCNIVTSDVPLTSRVVWFCRAGRSEGDSRNVSRLDIDFYYDTNHNIYPYSIVFIVMLCNSIIRQSIEEYVLQKCR